MSDFKLSGIILAPIVSEKSTIMAENNKRFAFKVLKQATKIEIKKAIELMFKVEVDSVHVLNMKGKTKQFGRNLGKRSDWKKSYVKLKDGHDIDFTGT